MVHLGLRVQQASLESEGTQVSLDLQDSVVTREPQAQLDYLDFQVEEAMMDSLESLDRRVTAGEMALASKVPKGHQDSQVQKETLVLQDCQV
jgi:hypothetical protein